MTIFNEINFFLKFFLGQKCFRQKKNYFEDKLNWMGANKNCRQTIKRGGKGGRGGVLLVCHITCVETLEAGKIPCIQGISIGMVTL